MPHLVFSSIFGFGQPAEPKPESLGFSSERLGRLREAMQRQVDDKSLVGVVTLGQVASDGSHLKIHSRVRGFEVFKDVDGNGGMITEPPIHPPTVAELLTTHTAGFTYGLFGSTAIDKV